MRTDSGPPSCVVSDVPESRTIPLPDPLPKGPMWDSEGAFKLDTTIDGLDSVWVLSEDGRSLFSGGRPRKLEDDSVSPAEFLAEAARRRVASKANR